MPLTAIVTIYRFMDLQGCIRVSQVALVVKNLHANAGDIRDTGSVPGPGRAPEGGHGNPLQFSCLENPIDRGSWWAAVHRVAKSQTWLKQGSVHARAHTHTIIHWEILAKVFKMDWFRPLKNLLMQSQWRHKWLDKKATWSVSHPF